MQVVVNALIGLGVMVACLAPPILHFVTGPLGPAIGGFIAGIRSRCTFEQAALTGLLMSALLTAVAAVVMTLAVELAPPELRSIDARFLTWIGLAAFLYVLLLATLGAWIGGAYARRTEPTTPPPSSIHD